LVLNNGRLSYSLGCRKNSAILEGWHLGTQSGNAIAQVLYDYNQVENCQCLSLRNVGQRLITIIKTGRPIMNEPESVFVLILTKNTPQFPFRTWSCYSKFEYSGFELSSILLQKVEN
jgi:beta-glucosidase